MLSTLFERVLKRKSLQISEIRFLVDDAHPLFPFILPDGILFFPNFATEISKR